MKNYLYDEHGVRYHQVQKDPESQFNWLFVPGGPGADSAYLLPLIAALEIKGNIWLIDFPGNGGNKVKGQKNYNYDKWLDIFIPTIAKFENPIYVGHSFGAMLPLLFPELEKILKGFVAINSSPSISYAESIMNFRKGLFWDVRQSASQYIQKPSFKNMANVIFSFFPVPSFKMLARLPALIVPFSFGVARWWIKKAKALNYTIEWVPEKLPTAIIGTERDFITPFSLYEKDLRFKKDNIILCKLPGSSHLSWWGHSVEINECVKNLVTKISKRPVIKVFQ